MPFNQRGNILILAILLVVTLVGGYLVVTPGGRKLLSIDELATPKNNRVREYNNTVVANQERKEKEVDFGEPFRLTMAEIAHVKDTEVYLKIVNFVYSPCDGCFWSGVAVEFDVIVGEKIYPHKYEAWQKDYPPYSFSVEGTDYTTYADFLIEIPDTKCTQEDDPDCWKDWAIVSGDPYLCINIDPSHSETYSACFEGVAEKLKDLSLCKIVTHPSHYCVLTKTVQDGNVEACGRMINPEDRDDCFRQIAEKKHMGIEICDNVPEADAHYCKSAFTTFRK